MKELKAELQEFASYADFKEKLDNNFKRQVNDFVAAGYMLKVARDTDILKESGYRTVAEFAKAEYGFSKDIVSRYIAINDRFSENGYSMTLASKYTEFGFTKLAEMLSIPEEIADELSPEMTRTQIQEVKKEVKAEQAISAIEVMCETKEKEFADNLEAFIYYYLEDKEEVFKELAKCTSIKALFEILAPAEDNILTARILGKGRYMLHLLNSEKEITLISVRTREKESRGAEELQKLIASMVFMKVYSEVYPEKAKVVPAQPLQSVEKSTETEKTEVKTEEFCPEPVQMNSICYSCLHNASCGQKSTITTECNEYINKAEAEKTDEQRYNEEQARIDRETAKKLKEKADEEKMQQLPSEKQEIVHEIPVGTVEYDEVVIKKTKRFMLLRNYAYRYRIGDTLELIEMAAGDATGRKECVDIIYILEEQTGLEEGYSILGIEMQKGNANE
jgi:hypothetical protein